MDAIFLSLPPGCYNKDLTMYLYRLSKASSNFFSKWIRTKQLLF